MNSAIDILNEKILNLILSYGIMNEMSELLIRVYVVYDLKFKHTW